MGRFIIKFLHFVLVKELQERYFAKGRGRRAVEGGALVAE